MVAAERLKRAWLGIDQNVQAVKVTELRLLQGRGLFSSDFTVHLHKLRHRHSESPEPLRLRELARDAVRRHPQCEAPRRLRPRRHLGLSASEVVRLHANGEVKRG